MLVFPLPQAMAQKQLESLDTVVIRFAGDSGDGMQITGEQFTNTAALLGNDLATFPDYPAEIRAPIGTLPGVSGYQVHFSSMDIYTPGDQPDVLVAMNPAALRANLEDLPDNGILIVDQEAFNEQNLKKAGYAANPLTDGSLDRFQLHRVDITRLTTLALKESGLSNKQVLRCKNFFTLGLVAWLYHRPVKPITDFIEQRFKKSPALIDANLQVRTVVQGLDQPTTKAFLGANDFLVLEKATGRVKRVVNGVVQSTVLDLAVNSGSERGLLGIALHPQIPTVPHVYLYWTESTAPGDSTVLSETPLLGNRVDRYVWNGSTLTPDQTEQLVRLASRRAGVNVDSVVVSDSGVVVKVAGAESDARLAVRGGALLLDPGVGGVIVLLQPAPSDPWTLQEAWISPEGLNVRGTVDMERLAAGVGGG